MPSPNLRPAELDAKSLQRVTQMEHELGSVIIAYHAETPFSHLSEDQLRRLKELEQELGVVLLAYKPQVAVVGG
jgi:hypothetical protein